MPLEHVLMWNKDCGWKPVTVREAAEKYPKTVPAYSRIFMCGKCHRYVFFADGKVKGRYFGHNRGDNDEEKECEDRTKYYEEVYDVLSDPKFSFKINYTRTGFSFYLGLLMTPGCDAEGMFEITSTAGNFVYNLSRFRDRAFEYFNVGEIPSSEYTILTENNKITTFPSKVIVLKNNFAVFSADTGKLLPEWANVQVNNDTNL